MRPGRAKARRPGRGVTAGRPRPLVTFSSSGPRPLPSPAPRLPTPGPARPPRSPRPLAPPGGPAPPGDRPRHCPPGRDAQAAALPPGAARPLTCGGRPAGRGRGGAGQQQGEPPGQPISSGPAPSGRGGGGGDGAGALRSPLPLPAPPSPPSRGLLSLPLSLLPGLQSPRAARSPPLVLLLLPFLLPTFSGEPTRPGAGKEACGDWQRPLEIGRDRNAGRDFGRGGRGEHRDRKISKSPEETDPEGHRQKNLRAKQTQKKRWTQVQKALETRVQRTASASLSSAPPRECVWEWA